MTIFGVTFLIIFSPLSFSPVGEMQVTPLLYCSCGYSVAVLFLRLLRYCIVSAVTPLLYFLCRLLRHTRYRLRRIVSADGEAGPVVEVDDGIRTVGPHYAVAAIHLYPRKLCQPRGVAMQGGNVEGRMA